MHAFILGILILVSPGILLSQEIDALQGCYAVEIGEWSEVDSNRIVSGPLIPDTIGLYLEGSEGVIWQDAGRRLEPREAIVGQMGGSYWSVQGDSVRLGWTTGHMVMNVHAAMEGESIRGMVVAGWDNRGNPPDRRATFHARETACPSREW